MVDSEAKSDRHETSASSCLTRSDSHLKLSYVFGDGEERCFEGKVIHISYVDRDEWQKYTTENKFSKIYILLICSFVNSSLFFL